MCHPYPCNQPPIWLHPKFCPCTTTAQITTHRFMHDSCMQGRLPISWMGAAASQAAFPERAARYHAATCNAAQVLQ
jgi:hypothetical protein